MTIYVDSIAAFAYYLINLKVNYHMELPPFKYPNPLGLFGGAKQVSSTISTQTHSHLGFELQIRAEAAYLYDAVHLYAKALIRVLESDENPRNGTAIINSLKGSSYLSAMG